MIHERQLTVTKNGWEMRYIYYVRKHFSEEFACDMYNVGIKMGDEKREIDDFSPDKDEAIRLCEYLYNENITVNNLFSVAEEFIVTL